jgi:hypothetical protein
MSIENRLKKVEMSKERNFNDRIKSLSDAELERIVEKYGDDDRFSEWLKTLTDDKLEIFCDDKPGARSLREKFDEYKKQNQKN